MLRTLLIGEVKITVYIAGPYTAGEISYNVAAAIDAAEKLSKAGLYPYIPHLNHYWALEYPHDYEFWMDQDFAFLDKCDILLRLRGTSPGADREVERAQCLDIPVYKNIDDLIEMEGWRVK
jgi:hypothetical protein